MLRQLILSLFTPRVTPHRFALHSGERQTGATIADVRRDHVVRYEYAAQLLVERLDSPRTGLGLDAFCGNGYGTRILSDATGCTMLGLDASNEAIALADAAYADTRTIYATKRFPFDLPLERFNFAVSLESVEHVADYRGFLARLCACVNHGGILVLSTPNATRWSLQLNPNLFHYRHFEHAELVSLVREVSGGEMNLIAWSGQDIYRFDEGRIVEPLPEERMNLTPNREGQINIFAFARN